MPRRVVHDAVAARAHHARDGGREEGLPQPRAAREQEIAALGRKLVRVVLAHIVHALHVRARRHAQVAVRHGRIVVEVKGLKALRAEVEKPRELLVLLAHIVGAKAGAHLASEKARVAAARAGGLFLKIVVRKAHLREQQALFLLQAEVFLLQGGDGRARIRAAAQARGDDLRHRVRQLAVNVRNARALGVDRALPRAEIFRAPLLVLVIARQRTAHQSAVVSHRSPSLSLSVEIFLHPGVAAGCFRLFRFFLCVLGAHLLRRVQALFVPAL